jgi:hypothetical protein
MLVPACMLAGCTALASREAVVVCQAADTGTTLYGLSLGARETNPVVRWILDHFGKEGFVAVKAGVTLAVLHYYPVISQDLLAVADGITCAAAANNLRVARKLANPQEAEKKPGKDAPKE